MIDEDTERNLTELGWDIHKLIEVAGFYDTPSKLAQWKRTGKVPHYIKALLEAHVRIHRLVEYGNDSKPHTHPDRRRRQVTAADVEAHFASQNRERGNY